MSNSIKNIIFLSICLFLIACSNYDDGGFVQPTTHNFTVSFNQSYDNAKAEGALVTLLNKEDGKRYTGTSDNNGTVTLTVIPGVYSVNVSKTFTKEDYLEFSGQEALSDVNFNASMESVTINTQSISSTEMILVTGKIGRLLLKQVYYTGSDIRLGAGFRDQFFEIHNNSNQTIYLDGLYLAQVYGEGSVASELESFHLPNGQFDWSKAHGQSDTENANRSYIYSDEVLRFPGSGDQYPLLSGKSIIVAATALNHKAPLTVLDDQGEQVVYEVAEPERTIDLSMAHFEAYFRPFQESQGKTYLDSDVDNPNSVNMEVAFKSAGGKDLILDPQGRDAFVIFEADLEEFDTWDALPSPETTSAEIDSETKIYKQVPIDAIIDGVETQRNDPAKAQPKRLPDAIDAGDVATVQGSFSSESVIRKQSESVGDRTFYQDTNNSSNDFKVITHPEVTIE